MYDERVREAAERAEPRSFVDHYAFEARMIAETEPRPCRGCGSRDSVQRLHRVELRSRGGDPADVPTWYCDRCDRWGYPVIAEPADVRRFYESKGKR